MQHIPIFLSSDDKYSAVLSVAMHSICYNTSNFIEFYVLDGGITTFSKKLISKITEKFNNCSVEFIEIDVNKYFKDFKTGARTTVATYFRFLIPDLKPNIDRAIYIDCDVVVLDDIVKLYEEDLGDYIIGAIPEYGYDLINILKDIKNNYNINLEHIYFNAGVLLIDCDKWRRENVTQKLFELEQKYKSVLIHLDQDILNKYFDCNYKRLNIKYNAQYFNEDKIELYAEEYKQELRTLKQNIVVRHFIQVKPWCNYSRILPYYNNVEKYVLCFKEFWFFAKMTYFYESLLNEYICKSVADGSLYSSKLRTFKIKFCGISLLTIKKSKVYLFNIIPLFRIKYIFDAVN